jgi:hypothetical protein
MKYTDNNNNNLLALVIADVAIITTAAAIMTPLDAFATQSQSQSQASQGSDQSQRVGVHDNAQQTSGEGAQQGGTVTDPTTGTITANCFGKVIQHEAQEHKENPSEGTLGQHSSDPVPDDLDNETPRQGIGNQDQGHPAAHGAFNAQFEDEDAQNVEENC